MYFGELICKHATSLLLLNHCHPVICEVQDSSWIRGRVSIISLRLGRYI